MTADIPVEQLYAELVHRGIVKKCDEVCAAVPTCSALIWCVHGFR